MMDIRPVRNEQDLTWALGEVERYFDEVPAPGTPEADRFDVLCALIEAYEGRHHPVPEADPVAVLRFAIESLGRSQAELAGILRSRSRASEVLAGKRPLTLDMIAAVGAAWRIPVAALMPSQAASRAA